MIRRLHPQVLCLLGHHSSVIVQQQARPFTVTAIRNARRKTRLAELSRENQIQAEPLTGDINKDGMHRYELDFVETASWCRRILESMRDDVQTLKDKAKPLQLPTTESSPLVAIQTRTQHAYDFSKPPIPDTSVTLHLLVSELGLSQSQHHKLALLCGDELYNQTTGILSLTESSSHKTSINRELVADKVKKLIEEAKNADADSFADVPLPIKRRSRRNTPRLLELPREWITVNNKTAEPNLA
ncbi:hypothetical protein SmJEL517_g04135 [Synchytrium microbalum]|uniref:Small ribosomal subunit protein mS35 mitochondrial conserved domain-containing protein n=1 Tax=Synchytrium microbalum TaxID=1806994 RepID=A0A507BTC7_9FUNG|nr:uncharacterized protein SmJEL517_g04135 [Synchytrium microbalum]TPX32810.1 hypothetical protein SmJEL517_g04135 [Synchytrium microbalum]